MHCFADTVLGSLSELSFLLVAFSDIFSASSSVRTFWTTVLEDKILSALSVVSFLMVAFSDDFSASSSVGMFWPAVFADTFWAAFQYGLLFGSLLGRFFSQLAFRYGHFEKLVLWIQFWAAFQYVIFSDSFWTLFQLEFRYEHFGWLLSWKIFRQISVRSFLMVVFSDAFSARIPVRTFWATVSADKVLSSLSKMSFLLVAFSDNFSARILVRTLSTTVLAVDFWAAFHYGHFRW